MNINDFPFVQKCNEVIAHLEQRELAASEIALKVSLYEPIAITFRQSINTVTEFRDLLSDMVMEYRRDRLTNDLAAASIISYGETIPKPNKTTVTRQMELIQYILNGEYLDNLIPLDQSLTLPPEEFFRSKLENSGLPDLVEGFYETAEDLNNQLSEFLREREADLEVVFPELEEMLISLGMASTFVGAHHMLDDYSDDEKGVSVQELIIGTLAEYNDILSVEFLMDRLNEYDIGEGALEFVETLVEELLLFDLDERMVGLCFSSEHFEKILLDYLNRRKQSATPATQITIADWIDQWPVLGSFGRWEVHSQYEDSVNNIIDAVEQLTPESEETIAISFNGLSIIYSQVVTILEENVAFPQEATTNYHTKYISPLNNDNKIISIMNKLLEYDASVLEFNRVYAGVLAIQALLIPTELIDLYRIHPSNSVLNDAGYQDAIALAEEYTALVEEEAANWNERAACDSELIRHERPPTFSDYLDRIKLRISKLGSVNLFTVSKEIEELDV